MPSSANCGIAGNIQPRRLAGLSDLIDDGLLQRFMVVHTRPALPQDDDDPPLPVEAEGNYRRLHDALAALQPTSDGGKPKQVEFSTKARQVRQEFMQQVTSLRMDTTLPSIIRETVPKWSGAAGAVEPYHASREAGRA